MDQNMSMFFAPWALALGCSLVAASALYVIGVEFLKTRLQAIGALLGGLLVLAVAELALIADNGAFFFNAQKIHVSQCYVEGEGAFPEARATKDNDAGRYIEKCVVKLGYEWSPEHKKCQEFLVPMNAFCYLPTDFLSRGVTKFQLLFEQ